MPIHFVELGKSYVIWSTETSAPLTFALNRRQLHSEWKRRIMRTDPYQSFLPTIENVDQKIIRDRSVQIEPNRAGPDGSSLSREELDHFYVEVKQAPTADSLEEWRSGREAREAAAEAARALKADPGSHIVICAVADCRNKTTSRQRYCDDCAAIRKARAAAPKTSDREI